MAKWISSLFKDIAGQVAKQNVFSRWKGRHYFRSYVIPANPKTNKQLAQRALMSNAVSEWQANKKGNPDIETPWDHVGEYRRLPGFQIFSAYVAGSEINTDPGNAGEIVVTGSTNMILGDAAIIAHDLDTDEWISDSIWTIDQKENFTHTITGLTPGDVYEIWLLDVYVSGNAPSPSHDAARVSKWYKDETAGTAVSNQITCP